MKKMVILLFAIASLAHAQAPTGVRGTVTDPSGLGIPGIEVVILSVETERPTRTVTDDKGNYYALQIAAGEYRVTASQAGFQTLTQSVTVRTESVVPVDFSLQLMGTTSLITVPGDPLVYDFPSVGSSITRSELEFIPVNGPIFQELAKHTPGVLPPVILPNRVNVPSLGAPGAALSGRGTLQIVDKASIMSVSVGELGGGSPMRFSPGIMHEFRVSTANFDLSTPSTVSGVLNAETRSGGNAFHGESFFYFRDQNLAAYPALKRDAANPDPSFQRQEFGVNFSGPILRDSLSFFSSWERSDQRGVGTTTLTDPDFAHMSRITASPALGDLFSLRVDGYLSNTRVIARYSHDGNRSYGPHPNRLNHYPTAWNRANGWAGQALLGVISGRGDVVNDFRFSHFFHTSELVPIGEEDCPGCLGLGAPSITVAQAGLTLGWSKTGEVTGRRFQISDSVIKMSGKHRFHFGANWEHNRDSGWAKDNDPATITLYSPTRARRAGIAIPETFQTLDDILALPLQTVTVSVGEPRVPQADGGSVRNWDTALLFFQDKWQFTPSATVNYGLAWNIDRNLNYDLSKPRLLAPIVGENGLGPTQKDWKNFSPAVGMTWTPSSDRKTALRWAAGLYYDFLFPAGLDNERVALGPPGLGRQDSPGSSIPNPLPGIPGVPVGTPLHFPFNPTQFRGADLISALDEIHRDLEENRQNDDPSVQQIEVTKQAMSLNKSEVPRASALHVSAGIKRQVVRGFFVDADVVFKRFTHTALGQVDANHFDSIDGPLIPKCASPQESEDPAAQCSNGAITFISPVGRADYTGLLVRAQKEFLSGSQVVASWAYSRITGTTGGGSPGFNLFRWHENRGPLPTDFTHILNVYGMTRLPWRFMFNFNFAYSSAPPFSAYLGDTDLNGDGTKNDLLPGTTVNAFNRGMGPGDLERLVSQFNSTEQLDASGNTIPKITLPAQYSFADNFQALDVRFSRSFPLKGDRVALRLMLDIFNVYNAANLSGHSGNLTNSSTFGQPTNRYSQIFGSGGPRAFQLGGKLSF
jgi:hypothetical protein